ncbi:MAG: DNA-3-methyladenine glycosylase [Ferruginibacter sp.]|nr:DNA-3-methyladenine glycosylase [Ferruginibacter sp.]
MRKLDNSFYNRGDVLQIARELLGKIVVTKFEGKITSGMIVETEAYVAVTDRASHSFAGKRTARNEQMYAAAGTTYVYICYGMHQMLNVVTNAKDVPDAILLRAIEPVEGVDLMLQRTGKAIADFTLTKGPGNVAKALGISKKHSGLKFTGTEIFICTKGDSLIPREFMGTSKRIGVEGAGTDASLLYRFYIKGNKFVSGRPVK